MLKRKNHITKSICVVLFAIWLVGVSTVVFAAENDNFLGLSDKDRQELKALQKMERSGKLEECLKVGFTVANVMYPFTMAAAASHYNVPGAQLEPGTVEKSGELLEDLSANVSDKSIGDALYELGQQIKLQESRRPLEITPGMQAQMDHISGWLDANCHPHKNEEGEQAGKKQPVGPAEAAQPVPRVPSDATGVAFGELSANDVAILKAAEGIQLGDPGSADVQIIFDPNGPNGARLYRYLRKVHPDLAVRWVPIAYFGKTSAAVTGILLNSRNARQDLNTDLRYYDFDRHQGGVQPGSGKADPLPSGQKRLRKAWEKWGGHTPMIVFRDQSDRWLRTGGSGKRVINSVLARAAK